MDTKAQKAGVAGLAGLNAAALIFLYTNFVTKEEHKRLEDRLHSVQEQVVYLKARSDMEHDAIRSKFE